MYIDELKLFASKYIVIPKTGILKPILIDEIIEIGEQKYYTYLNNLCFNIDDLKTDLDTKLKLKEDNVETFDIMAINCTKDEVYCRLICKALTFFFHKRVRFIPRYAIFYIGDIRKNRIIHKGNYEEIKSVLRILNCVEKNDSVSDNPNDERARRLLNKRNEARKKLQKAKNKDNDGEESEPLNLADLVSILCANGNGITPFNVGNLSIYTFQNQFNRMKMFSEYDINIKSLLAGAKKEDIELIHWMSKIK